MSDPAERRLGSVIANKWRVDALLGSGSMAAVYAVTHRNGARAALKILHPTLCTDEGVCERFLGEGYLTNSVKHSGIVRVLDDGVTDDGCVFLVMDLLEGVTLEAHRQDRGGQIPLVEMLDIADRLMDVLHAVHEAGIIHRDLKPQNVFVCADGSVKLLDFGVARVFDGTAQSKLSMFGLVLGTPSFMSPEQAVGSRDKVDHSSDIWSLGATIFTGLTGQTVHLAPHVQAKLLAAATVKARSISMAKQDLPASIALAIDTALRFKKEERWQSVAAFRRALREARCELGLGKPESVLPPGVLEGSDALATTGHNRRLSGLFEGPTRTLVGSGGIGTVPGDDGDEASETLPHMAAASRVPRPLDVPARTPGYSMRPPMESRPDGSYPAATATHTTLSAQVGARSSGAATWIAACLIAGAAIAGVAFFSMKRAKPAEGQSARAAEAPLTSATPQLGNTTIAPSVPTPTLQVDPRDLLRDASPPESPIKASVSPPSLRTAHAAGLPVVRTPPRLKTPDHLNPRPTGEEPQPTPPGKPPIPTEVPPDPFGTPE